MKVIYSEQHALHDPPRAFAGGRQVAYGDPPARAEAILLAVREAGFPVIAPGPCPRDALLAVHSEGYLEHLAGAYDAWVASGRPAEGVIPHVFPIREVARTPAERSRQAGRYCFDTETPIAEHTFEAALASAACALAGAELLLRGDRHAYALCRPPGHHAGPDYCGGYCYLNNAALAASRLTGSRRAKAAVLDLDFHHGNGTQDVFYASAEVLYASVHGDPNCTFPYYWGYADETGAGEGAGCNLNIPLAPGASAATYRAAVERALEAVAAFKPQRLVVSLGADTAEGDPFGAFGLTPDSFAWMGRAIAGLRLPTLVVQEGGYDPDITGRCVVSFLMALGGGE